MNTLCFNVWQVFGDSFVFIMDSWCLHVYHSVGSLGNTSDCICMNIVYIIVVLWNIVSVASYFLVFSYVSGRMVSQNVLCYISFRCVMSSCIIMTSQKLCSSECCQSIAKIAKNEDLLFNRIVVEHSGIVLWHVQCYISLCFSYVLLYEIFLSLCHYFAQAMF